jgi:PKHD-type hydroxylase
VAVILCLDAVLNAEQLARARAATAEASFVDGAATAGWHAKLVKRNRQAAPDDPAATRLKTDMVAALRAHPTFRAAVLPRIIRPPLISRYDAGHAYGTHVDDALMGGDSPVRSDVSVTIFIASPDDYDGGELVIESSDGEFPYKLPAGAAIVYPSTHLHRVEPVTRGVREVAVTWVQSLVRDARHREALYDLDTARRALFKEGGKSRAFDLVAKTYANLLREWAEP